MKCKTIQKKCIKYTLSIAFLMILFIAFYVWIDQKQEEKSFALEENVIAGTPQEDPEDLSYSTLFVEEGYEIGICGTPSIEQEHLVCYLTNVTSNQIWIKAKIYDEQENLIGQTGMIKAGNYVEKIKLNSSLESQNIQIKIIAYEPETYQSRGNVSFKIAVH